LKPNLLFRLLPVFCLFIWFTSPLLAQKKGWQDVVYLKNGSIIRGELVEDKTAGIVKISTIGQNVFVFKTEEVDRVARELLKSDFKYPYTSGYQNITELGLSIGYRAAISQFENTSRVVNLSLQSFNGYQFFPLLAVGLTTGIDTYEQVTLLPVGLGLRGDLAKTRVRPFYGLDAGYALDWLNNPNLAADHDGGFFWSPSLGLKFNSAKTRAFVLNLGYRSQKATATTQVPSVTSTDRKHYKRMLFRIGMSF